MTRVPKGVAAYQLDPKAEVLYYLVHVPAEPPGPFAKLKRRRKRSNTTTAPAREVATVEARLAVLERGKAP